MKMVSVTRTMSTLCLNKQHEPTCPGGLDGVACQCACHKTAQQPQKSFYPPGQFGPRETELDDMGFA
jgi:hypothetical protein